MGRSSTALPRALAALVPGVLAIPEEGWQHDIALVLEQRFVETAVAPSTSPARRAMLRSQGGPLSGLPFTTLPITPLHRFESHLFRVPTLAKPTLANVLVLVVCVKILVFGS